MAGFDPDEYLKNIATSSSGEKTTESVKSESTGFDPDVYLKGGQKSAGERFMEPLKSMSMEDWKKESFIAPAINYLVGASPFGTEEQYQEAKQNLTGKIGNLASSVAGAVTSPVETAKSIYGAVTENPAGVMGNIVKGAVYDPELLFAPGVRSVTAPVAKAAISPVTAPYKFGQGMLNIGRGELGGEASALRAISPEQTAMLHRAESAVNPNTGINPHMRADQVMAADAAGAIPKQNQLMQALGETVARGYTGPKAGMNALLDFGPILAGVPIPISATAKVGAAVYNNLFNKNAFKKLNELERVQEIIKKAKE